MAAPMLKTAGRGLAVLGILIALALLVTGCGPGLPDHIVDAADKLKTALKEGKKQVLAQKEKFEAVKSDNSFSDLAPYADRENWSQDFVRAGQILSRAEGLYDSELAPLLKADKPESADQAGIQIKRIGSAVQEARAEARRPFDRMARIRSAMTDTRGIYSAARKNAEAVISEVSRLEKGPVAEALEKFPDSTQKITNRFTPVAKLADTSQTDLTKLDEQYRSHESSQTADYAVFIDAADNLSANRENLKKQGAALEEDIGRLYQSYTKVLQDMKVDYYLTVKRESWDESADYYDPAVSTFTRQVSPATYEALADTPVESIAEIIPSYGRVSFKNNVGSAWEPLGINPTENWPNRRHNAASFWIEDSREVYFHKYLQETNGETRETGWEKVNPSFYEQNVNNLGMAILSKPYGEFEPDTMAAPPGMAYVGNPEYGEWKKDDSGNSFWSWYGRYAFFSNLFFFPPSYYYYGSWNRWRTGYRHQKPYYGRTDSGQYTYGTRGTSVKNSPRYQNTTFAKTGGFKTAPASVRGGGSSIRGGGPKGKGK